MSRPGDASEQEADRIAEQVMRMPQPGRADSTRARESARAPASRHGSGAPLDPATRAFMEPRFGADFSQVRVHADDAAANSARSHAALAYTLGNDIVFGAGQYEPGTAAGRRLLAHELAHVQQAPTNVVRRQELTEDTSLLEGVVIEPEGSPAAEGGDFRGCSPEEDAAVSESLRIGWYATANAEHEVAAALTFPLDPDRHPFAVESELRSIFHTVDRQHLRVIRARLDLIRTIMAQRRAWNWVCRTEARCKAYPEGEPYAFAGPADPVNICPLFFGRNEFHRAQILIHESAHQAGLMRNRGGHDPGLSAVQTLDNADSYAVFAMERLYGGIARMSAEANPSGLYGRGIEIWISGEYMVFDSARGAPLNTPADARIGNEMNVLVRYFHGTAAPAVEMPAVVLNLRVTLERDAESRGKLPAREVLLDRSDDTPVAGVGLYAGRLLSSIPEFVSRPLSAADRGQLRVEASIADPGGTVLDAADFRVAVSGVYEPTTL